jgi:hypothetical protein
MTRRDAIDGHACVLLGFPRLTGITTFTQESGHFPARSGFWIKIATDREALRTPDSYLDKDSQGRIDDPGVV